MKRFFIIAVISCPIIIHSADAEPHDQDEHLGEHHELILRDGRTCEAHLLYRILRALGLRTLSDFYEAIFETGSEDAPEESYPTSAPSAAAAASAPVTAEVKTYEPANPHVCELMGFRPPEKPSMAGMTREDIELDDDLRWYIRDFETLDAVAAAMDDLVQNARAMELLGLTPIPPGKAHPTLFVSGERSHCPIQTSCPWLRCDCVQATEFRHLNKDTLYTAYHLVLIMWLHFAQGISLDIIHEWREAVYSKPMLDIHYQNTMKVVRTISELSHDPEKQERCIRIVFDELINR